MTFVIVLRMLGGAALLGVALLVLAALVGGGLTLGVAWRVRSRLGASLVG